MRSHVANHGGEPFRCTVFGPALAPGSKEQLLLSGERSIEHGQVVGGWTWKISEAGKVFVTGSCYVCGCLELRGMGWASVACLPRQFHLWQRPA